MKLIAPEPAPPPKEDKPLKVTLVNTPAKVNTLCKKLNEYHEGYVGFDTEVAGPLLRGRDFVNITHSSLLGLSLAFEDGKAYYVPVRHKGNNVKVAGLKRICGWLQANCHRVWAHNAKFDHQVMIRAGFPLELLLDSMVAAWLVTGKNQGLGLKQQALEVLGRRSPEFDPSISHKTGDAVKLYAGHDALNTLELGLHYRAQIENDDWFLEECKLTRVLAEMKLQGMRIDKLKLQTIYRAAALAMSECEETWKQHAGDIAITSSKQLQELFEDGTWTPRGTTAGGAFATDGKVIEWNVENAQTPAGRKLAETRLHYQEIAKIATTYTTGLIEEAWQWADGKLHPDKHHFGTVTGRFSSSNPNVENQPAHSEWASMVRECFVPDLGMEFTSADYSQVELRYFANYCGGKLLDILIEGQDPHANTAEAMDITRDQAKMVNFGFLLYGGGPDKLAAELKLPRQEAEERIEALHAEYPNVEKFRAHVVSVVSGRGTAPWCKTLAGRIRYIPELNQSWMRHQYPLDYQRLVKKYRDKCKMAGRKFSQRGLEMSIQSRGERLVVNYLVQGGSRDLLVLGMNEYRRKAPDLFTIVNTVHDEVLTQHPRGAGQVARGLLKESLEGAGPKLGLRVPIIAEPKTGAHWGEVK